MNLAGRFLVESSDCVCRPYVAAILDLVDLAFEHRDTRGVPHVVVCADAAVENRRRDAPPITAAWPADLLELVRISVPLP